MNRYGSKKHRVAAGLALVALMVVVAVVATTVEEPEANALPFGGGVPVRVWFNPDPARPGQSVQLWVELSEEATVIPHEVELVFPSPIQVPANNLASDPDPLIVKIGATEGYTTIEPTAAGWITVLAKLNGGRAGGVLEVE